MDNRTGKRQENRIVPPSSSANSSTKRSISSSQLGDAASQTSLVANDTREYLTKNQPAGRVPSPRNPTLGPTIIPAPAPAIAEPATCEKLSKLHSPVTKDTLGELDVGKIIHNPKLRHDINLDPELHFRPNLDGEKGRKKTLAINHFWDTFRQELASYSMDREQFERNLGDATWCLPVTLNAIRDILETLVPQQDRASVEETFNVEMLMQQFRNGVADLDKLANWLSVLLKSHCAPMRDDWVDDVVRDLSSGNRTGDVALFVQGLRNTLAVLEAMKLDVANHQIRCLRPLLIEGTVNFLQNFFLRKIELGKVDIDGAHEWFRQKTSFWAVPGAAGVSMQQNAVTWEFFRALVDLILPSKSTTRPPHTFLFDEERLLKLLSDMQDLINLEVCMDLYRALHLQGRLAEQLARDDTPNTISYSASPSVSSGYSSPSSISTRYSSPTVPTEQDFSAPKSPQRSTSEWSPTQPFEDQVWTAATSGTTSPSSSSSSSPCSSSSSTTSTAESYPQTPLYLSQPPSDASAGVRASLRAILASCPTTDKWTTLAPSLALQIVRSTTTPLVRLPQFESHLATHLSNNASPVYLQAEERVLSQLLPVVKELSERYVSLTNLQMFEAATSPRSILATRTQGPGALTEIRDVATRVAHIGSLHWRVWGELVYLVDPRIKVMEPESRSKGP